MAVYNVSKIENWYNDFLSCKNTFINSYYDDYKNSYIKKCNDSTVNKMESKLDSNYNRIKRIYNNINKFWSEYLEDLKNTDNRLAGNKVNVNASSVSSKLSKLPDLKSYKADLSIKVNSASAVVGTVKGIGWSEDRTTEENLDYIGNRIGATIATAGTAVVEGVFEVFEAITDILVLAGATVASAFTGTIDLIAKASGNETNLTSQLWEETRAFTSQDIVGSTFDLIYDYTSAGNWMKNNAYGFETIRQIGVEVGEVVGVVAISTITGGSGAVIYGSVKAAEHTETNWQDENTSTAAGLFKGILEGVGDGIFFGIGMKGDKIAQAAAKKVGASALKKAGILSSKMLFEAGTAIAQDFSNILVNASLSKNVITDANGQIVKLNTFKEKCDFYYNQAGGLKGIATSAATSFVLSGLSDSIDIYGVKNIDVNTSSMKNTLEGIDTKHAAISSGTKEIDGDVDSIKALNGDATKNVEVEGYVVGDTKGKIRADAINFKNKMKNTSSDLNNAAKNTTNKIKNKISEVDISSYNKNIKNKVSDISSNINKSVHRNNLKISSKIDLAKSNLQLKVTKAGLNIMGAALNLKESIKSLSEIPNKIKNSMSTPKNSFDGTSKSINKVMKEHTNLTKALVGVFASFPSTITKMKNVDIKSNSSIFKKIKNEGLYHFTDEISANKILNSGYIKESSHFTSYGKKRTFMFAGIPTIEDTCINGVFDYKKVAVKLKPSDAEINKLQYRKYSDSAISSVGNYDITNDYPEIAYLVLKEQDGALKYAEVSKQEFDNYNPNFNDNVITKTVNNASKKWNQYILAFNKEYDYVKKGIKQIKNDLTDKSYKLKKITLSPRDINIKNSGFSSSGIKKAYSDIEVANMRKEYDKLLNKADTPEFKYYQELADNGGAGDLRKIQNATDDINRMKFLEEQLGIPKDKSSIPTPEKWSDFDKENIETSFKPEKKPIYNYGETASPEQFLIKNINDFSMKSTNTTIGAPHSLLMESDINKDILNYKSNPDLINYTNKEVKIDKKRISELEKAFGLNYTNDMHDKKIINGIQKLVVDNNFSDDNVAKIMRNIDAISSENPNFKIYESGCSAFARKGFSGKPELLLSQNLLEHSTGAISQTSLHEMGHAYLHIFSGDIDNAYAFTLPKETKKVLQDSVENLNNNPEKYITYLKKSQNVYNDAFSETVKWYDEIRPQENERISKIIDNLFKNNDTEGLKKVVSDANGMGQVKTILKDSGLSMEEIDEIINNKELVKKIAITQNNINNQQTYLDELMGSYDNYGDYRKISSTINSMTQKVEHIDPSTGDKVNCTFAHSDDYWSRIGKEDALRSTYDELCADYFSLAAHGRNDVINAMEDMFGTELMDSIRGEFKKIADTLELKGLIKY